MGGLTTQTLALILLLSPGLLFLFGFHTAPPQWPVRRPLQTTLLVDTAVFVVISLTLHICAGLLLLGVVDWRSSCQVVGSVAAAIGATNLPASLLRCGLDTDIFVLVLYFAVVGAAAFWLGRVTAKQIALSPRLFRAMYGPHFETFERSGAYIVANVQTDIEHDGSVLMYEGELIELSLRATGEVAFITLASPKRFYLSFGETQTATTPRDDFVAIDRAEAKKSWLTIPGDHVANVLTRTYPIEVQPDWRRSDAGGWIARGAALASGLIQRVRRRM